MNVLNENIIIYSCLLYDRINLHTNWCQRKNVCLYETYILKKQFFSIHHEIIDLIEESYTSDPYWFKPNLLYQKSPGRVNIISLHE
jgi:hypothetical protein